MKTRIMWLAWLAALFTLPAHADYRGLIPYGQSYAFEFTLRNASASALATGLTLVSGECKVSKAGGADANCNTLPTAIASTNKYLFTIGATEAQTTRLAYTLVDSTGTAYFAREFTFDTCGHPSARFPVCPGSPPQVIAVGTCDNVSTNLVCNYSSLTQADGYWAVGVSFQIPGQPSRCVNKFTNTTHRLEFSQALAATSQNQPFALLADPSCPKY